MTEEFSPSSSIFPTAFPFFSSSLFVSAVHLVCVCLFCVFFLCPCFFVCHFARMRIPLHAVIDRCSKLQHTFINFKAVLAQLAAAGSSMGCRHARACSNWRLARKCCYISGDSWGRKGEVVARINNGAAGV